MNEHLKLRDEQITTLVQEGLTTTEIAERLGLHRSAVNRSRIRSGLRVPKPRKRANIEEIREEFLSLYRQGFADRAIANRMQRSHSTIQRVRTDLNLSPNGRFKHDRELVASMYHDGASNGRIAEVLGTTVNEVAKLRSELRLVKPRPIAIPDDRRAEVVTMLEDGASYNEVARTTGLCQTSIQRNFPGQGWTREQISEFASIRRLAERVGV